MKKVLLLIVPLVFSLTVVTLAQGQLPKLPAEVERQEMTSEQIGQRLSDLEAELTRLRQMLEVTAEKEVREKRVRVKERVRAERQRYMLQSLVQRTVVGGYFELEFKDFDSAKARPDLGFGSFDGTSGFDLHRTILLVASDISDALSFATELEFEHGAQEIELEYAALDYKFFGGLNLRAGVVLLPLGRLNLLHDGPIRDLVTRPLVARRIIPSTYSEAGGGLFGNFSLGKALGQEALQDFHVNYELYLVNGLQGEDGGTLFISKGGGTRDARRGGL
ncbi:MAG: hypothetical protein V3S39_01465, partial [Thermodesulfobacteriota bacterium]